MSSTLHYPIEGDPINQRTILVLACKWNDNVKHKMTYYFLALYGVLYITQYDITVMHYETIEYWVFASW